MFHSLNVIRLISSVCCNKSFEIPLSKSIASELCFHPQAQIKKH